MNKGLKITAIAILLVILSPLISVLLVVAVAVLLCKNDTIERFDEVLHKLSEGQCK